MASDSLYPEDWLRIARRDWQRVGRALAGGDPELAAFLLQQSLEKYLKAYLLARGWELRRTRELTALLRAATAMDPSLDRYFGLCERISGYYMVERYPALGAGGIAEEDLAEDVSDARPFILALHAGEDIP